MLELRHDASRIEKSQINYSIFLNKSAIPGLDPRLACTLAAMSAQLLSIRSRFLPVATAAVLLLFLFVTACQKAEHAAGQAETAAATEVAPGKVADPVCGMEVDPATAPARATYAGKTYYFCTKEEKEQFDKDPGKYVKKES
jgi:YHS domain-containing protein